MKKAVLIFFLIIFILFVISKIYCFVIINKLYDAIKEFEDEENRSYSVNFTIHDDVFGEEKVMAKENVIKHVRLESETETYCEWKNFNTNQKYLINFNSKEMMIKQTLNENEFLLFNIPDLIWKIYQNSKLNINELLKIKYIFPTKYNDKNCYKIITKTEEIIIDKSTNLPIYSKKKIINSENENKNEIEYTYKFRINDVTDEEMALPDLSEYKVIDK